MSATNFGRLTLFDKNNVLIRNIYLIFYINISRWPSIHIDVFTTDYKIFAYPQGEGTVVD